MTAGELKKYLKSVDDEWEVKIWKTENRYGEEVNVLCYIDLDEDLFLNDRDETVQIG